MPSKVPEKLVALAAVLGGYVRPGVTYRKEGTFYDVFTTDNRCALATVVKTWPRKDWLVCIHDGTGAAGDRYEKLSDLDVTKYTRPI